MPNRALFNERLAEVLRHSAEANTCLALVSIDIDRFKEVNDVFGHMVGDLLLCELARRLRSAGGDAFVARIGGDEFSLIVTGEQPATAERLCENLIASAGADFLVEGRDLSVGISIGVAVFPTDGTDESTLIRNADAALYRAKSDGRGTIRFFEAAMDKRLREQRALQQELRSALEEAQLRLEYQPQARVNGEIVGFEALLRWSHPQRGLVSPSVFIPLTEESGLIMPIGEWVLREACREAASWSRPLRVAVNLSPVQFKHGDLPGLVHAVLLETGLAPNRLELEITEIVLVSDHARALSILRRLKSLGVSIAMDDFGTGYSSLSYLQSFPFDKIKVDQAFISNLERNPQSATIVRAVIGLAQALNIPVVAEGVETQEQLAFLSLEMCDNVQGYFIGRPMPILAYADAVGRPADQLKAVA